MKEILPQYGPWPKRFEDNDDLMKRVINVKVFMNEYLQTNPLKADEKYGIVTHSCFIATMTAKGVDLTNSLGIKDYIFPKNC